jgi:CMP-N-acetylneuraminic acid synthetase
MNTVAFIFARGGSKGLPGKNIRHLSGKPLIAWSIEHAMTIKRIRRVVVSTDSHEIAHIARSFGAEVPFIRPDHLSSDNSPEWLAWRHALSFIKDEEGEMPDAMVCIPVTSPLRLPSDIESCLDVFESGGADIVLTVTEAHRNPYFNMVKYIAHDTVNLVMPLSDSINHRQEAPKVFDLATIAYVADPKFVMHNSGLFAGRTKAVHIPVERAIDIDTMLDFQIAEFLMNQRLTNNDLQ